MIRIFQLLSRICFSITSCPIDVSKFVEEVNNSRIRSGFEEVLVPGQRANKLLKHAEEEGIEIENKIYDELKRLAEK